VREPVSKLVAQHPELRQDDLYALAARICAHAEEAGSVEPAAGPVGTTVRAENLFANVPVRREYLRSPAAEFSRIASWLAMMALAYPAVAFTLEHEGKTTFAFPPDDDLAPRLRHVFGGSSQSMIAVRGGDRHAGVSGQVSSPGLRVSPKASHLSDHIGLFENTLPISETRSARLPWTRPSRSMSRRPSWSESPAKASARTSVDRSRIEARRGRAFSVRTRR